MCSCVMYVSSEVTTSPMVAHQLKGTLYPQPLEANKPWNSKLSSVVIALFVSVSAAVA